MLGFHRRHWIKGVANSGGLLLYLLLHASSVGMLTGDPLDSAHTLAALAGLWLLSKHSGFVSHCPAHSASPGHLLQLNLHTTLQ